MSHTHPTTTHTNHTNPLQYSSYTIGDSIYYRNHDAVAVRARGVV
jgi:hypothetical protein